MRWALRRLEDVPPDDSWLTALERALVVGLGPRRRADWRLGRWTAKALLGPEAEILPAGDGAPVTRGASLSISHRKGRALAVVAERGVRVGCDLEPLRPHGDAFLRSVLSAEELRRVENLSGDARTLVATVAWTAKEAAYKALRGGREIRAANAGFPSPDFPAEASFLTDGRWRPVYVDWPDGAPIGGWWRAADGWAMTIAADPPAPEPPQTGV